LKREHEFISRVRIPAPVHEVFSWHSRPGAIQRLSPPWDPLRIISVSNGILPGSRVVMSLQAGPVPFTWEALHTRYEKNRLFEDIQVRGPFSSWTHVHAFFEDEKRCTLLEDRISYALPFHPMGTFVLNRLVEEKLSRIFNFRHKTTMDDILFHRAYDLKPGTRFLVSGASGMIGSSLVPFLTTAGYRVWRLVRRRADPAKNEIFWDPAKAKIDAKLLEDFDAVIHLSGENIGRGRWTNEKKKRIIESRVMPTLLLAETMAGLKKPPMVFISASAIGFYGNRSGILSEENGPGEDFISDVCKKWEAAAKPAINAGIRTVFPRIGVVLHPAGGALKKMLPLFSIGLGGRIGHGRQFMSWIGMDDVLSAMVHITARPEIRGPVNLVSPLAVTNEHFAHTLARVLRRPLGPPVPEALITALFGEMGKETVLSSTRVRPKVLMDTGYTFRHPELKQMLCHVLGRYQESVK